MQQGLDEIGDFASCIDCMLSAQIGLNYPSKFKSYQFQGLQPMTDTTVLGTCTERMR